MAIRLKSAWVPRAAVAAAALAFPLLGAGAAQAAIAGANPSTTNGRPDLRSATILDATDISVCFNKALSATSTGFTAGGGGAIKVGGYAAGNLSVPAVINASPSDTKCAIASFNSSVGDLNQRTFVTVQANTFQAAASGLLNLPDSVTLTGSTTHNGTTGLTVGPNLSGIATPASSTTKGVLGTLTYTFDQSLSSVLPVGGPVPGDFFFVDVTGNPCFATGASASGSSVVASFPNTCTTTMGTALTSINDARRGGVLRGAVFAASTVPGEPVANPETGAVIAGSAAGGVTTLPDLMGATLLPDQNTVTYQFSKPIIAGFALAPADFTVWLSNGRSITPTSVTVAGSNSVNAVFTNLADTISEYAVLASVDGNAAADLTKDTATNGYTDVPGSAAIGDNAGAFARGFTTGPDVFSVTFNKTASNPFVSVNLDQRAMSLAAPNVLLLDANGGIVGIPSGPAPVLLEPAGPETINVPFTSGELANATQVLFGFGVGAPGCAFSTNLGGPDGCSVNQIVAPISSAVRLQSIRQAARYARTHKAHKHHSAKRNHRKH